MSEAIGDKPLELLAFVRDFAKGIEMSDSRHPQAMGRKRTYQLGIGPDSEEDTIRLVMAELKYAHRQRHDEYELDVTYPNDPRNRCDICLGYADTWLWALEAKMLRLFGDNGKPNDNMLMHILFTVRETQKCSNRLREGQTIPDRVLARFADIRLRTFGIATGPRDRCIRKSRSAAGEAWATQ